MAMVVSDRPPLKMLFVVLVASWANVLLKRPVFLQLSRRGLPGSGSLASGTAEARWRKSVPLNVPAELGSLMVIPIAAGMRGSPPCGNSANRSSPSAVAVQRWMEGGAPAFLSLSGPPRHHIRQDGRGSSVLRQHHIRIWQKRRWEKKG